MIRSRPVTIKMAAAVARLEWRVLIVNYRQYHLSPVLRQ